VEIAAQCHEFRMVRFDMRADALVEIGGRLGGWEGCHQHDECESGGYPVGRHRSLSTAYTDREQTHAGDRMVIHETADQTTVVLKSCR
jgi:hypothetical protein